MTYYYMQASHVEPEGIWIEVSREFFVDCTWAEADTEAMEQFLVQTKGYTVTVRTNTHGYRIDQPRDWDNYPVVSRDDRGMDRMKRRLRCWVGVHRWLWHQTGRASTGLWQCVDCFTITRKDPR